MPQPIRVGVVESNRLLREYLTRIVAAESGMVVAFSRPALSLAESSQPVDVILTPCQTEHYPTVRQIMTTFASAKVVAINVDPGSVELVSCVRAGVAGFVLAESSAEDLVKTIRTVAAGDTIFPPTMLDDLCRQLYRERDRPSPVSLIQGLVTPRELQIVHLVSEGLTNKEIAQKLNVSVPTVKSHVHNVMEKLRCRSRIDLATYSWRWQAVTRAAPAAGTRSNFHPQAHGEATAAPILSLTPPRAIDHRSS